VKRRRNACSKGGRKVPWGRRPPRVHGRTFYGFEMLMKDAERFKGVGTLLHGAFTGRNLESQGGGVGCECYWKKIVKRLEVACTPPPGILVSTAAERKLAVRLEGSKNLIVEGRKTLAPRGREV